MRWIGEGTLPHFGSNDFQRVLDLAPTPSRPDSQQRTHCCSSMTTAVNYTCPNGHERFDCPDQLLHYCAPFDEYGLIVHDDGASYLLIKHCPWCAAFLPQPKRQLWFDTLESMGFDEPLEQEIPESFRSDAWYRGTT